MAIQCQYRNAHGAQCSNSYYIVCADMFLCKKHYKYATRARARRIMMKKPRCIYQRSKYVCRAAKTHGEYCFQHWWELEGEDLEVLKFREWLFGLLAGVPYDDPH